MAATELRFYLDEHLDVEIAHQLTRLGIDVVTARDVESFGESDPLQLQRSTEMGRVFCTNDSDLLDLASQGVQHMGIVFGQQEKHFIGIWVKQLNKLTEDYRAGEMVNHVVYLSTPD